VVVVGDLVEVAVVGAVVVAVEDHPEEPVAQDLGKQGEELN